MKMEKDSKVDIVRIALIKLAWIAGIIFTGVKYVKMAIIKLLMVNVFNANLKVVLFVIQSTNVECVT